MNYKKVFTKSRFHTKSRNSFQVDHKSRSIVVGARDSDRRTAFIGKVIEHGKASTVLDYGVFCDVGFPHVIGIFGNRGSGKSFDLGVFIEELYSVRTERDDDAASDAAIVFDVQDQFWTLGYQPNTEDPQDTRQMAELERWGLTGQVVKEVSIFIPSSSDTQVPGATIFCLSASQVSDADYLAILELDRFSAMGQAFLTLHSAHGPKPPGELAAACTSHGPLAGFQAGTVDGLRWRLDGLAKTGIIEQNGVGIDTLLCPGRVSVVLMRNLGESIRALVVGVISRLVADRMGRAQQSRKVARRTGVIVASNAKTLANKVWMVLDEAHVLIPSDGATPATGPLIDYVKRGRDAGLSLVFATQQPSAVNSKLMSQVDMTLTHMLGFEADVIAAVNRMPTRNAVDYEVDNEKVPSIGDVIRSLAPGEAVLADGASGRILLVKIRPRCTAHGGETPG